MSYIDKLMGHSDITNKMVSGNYFKVFSEIKLNNYYKIIEKFDIPNVIYTYLENYCKINKDLDMADAINELMPIYNPIHCSAYFSLPNDRFSIDNKLIYMIIRMKSDNDEYYDAMQDSYVDVNVEWAFTAMGLSHCNLLTKFIDIDHKNRDILENKIKDLVKEPLNSCWEKDFNKYIKPNINLLRFS